MAVIPQGRLIIPPASFPLHLSLISSSSPLLRPFLFASLSLSTLSFRFLAVVTSLSFLVFRLHFRSFYGIPSSAFHFLLSFISFSFPSSYSYPFIFFSRFSFHSSRIPSSDSPFRHFHLFPSFLLFALFLCLFTLVFGSLSLSSLYAAFPLTPRWGVVWGGGPGLLYVTSD